MIERRWPYRPDPSPPDVRFHLAGIFCCLVVAFAIMFSSAANSAECLSPAVGELRTFFGGAMTTAPHPSLSGVVVAVPVEEKRVWDGCGWVDYRSFAPKNSCGGSK